MGSAPPGSAPHLILDLDTSKWTVVLILLALTALAAMFVWALLRSAYYPAPIALVVALSVLSLTAIGAALVTGNGDFITLSATGIGALAGAVSSTYHNPLGRAPPRPKPAPRQDDPKPPET